MAIVDEVRDEGLKGMEEDEDMEETTGIDVKEEGEDVGWVEDCGTDEGDMMIDEEELTTG